jgi:DNA polymerase III sliding clamp (beta) subunit (PCNA family)
MWAWTDDNQYLVIGDGYRLGAHYTGIKNLELPVNILSEICRILNVWESEKVTLHIGENQILALTGQVRFQATLPKGSKFDTAWHNEMKSLLEDDSQILKVSRSKLLSATKQVKITAGESTVKIASPNGLILASIDEHKDTGGSRVECNGSLREQISLNIEHLESALEALRDESVILKVCKSLVEVSDTRGWEIIPRK